MYRKKPPSIFQWQTDRTCGTCPTSSQLHSNLYYNVRVVRIWNPRETVKHSDHGGVFNFDFSPDGRMLVAACERKSLLLFDPLRATLISSKTDAHNNCVNCVRFLDNRLFTTCSDDNNIALWDARYLKRNIRLLQGHTNWVKNIEYSDTTGRLVTSGFDGSIFSWDINRYNEGACTHELLFRSSGLIRTKLTPDSSKMIISTSAGYMMVIHNLDLTTLQNDLYGFKPDIFRLMQVTKSVQRLGAGYQHLFTRHKNRVEFISDFPPANDAEVVSSLQVHPQSWCVLSRNTSSDDLTEWSCVHDIQERPFSSTDLPTETKDSDPGVAETPSYNISSLGAALMFSIMGAPSSPGIELTPESQEYDVNIINVLRGFRPRVRVVSRQPSSHSLASTITSQETDTRLSQGERNRRIPVSSPTMPSDRIMRTSNRPSQGERNRPFEERPTPEESPSIPPDRIMRTSNRPSSSVPLSTVNAGSSRISTRPFLARTLIDRRITRSITRLTNTQRNITDNHTMSATETEPSDSARTRYTPNRIVTFRLQLDGHNADMPDSEMPRTITRTIYLPYLSEPSEDDKTSHIHDNVPRLVAYAEEANTGRGFIKEPCFSTDGRVICSPFGFGVRLLAFNSSCDELCDCVPDTPLCLHEIANCIGHSNAVVTTKFSPVHNLLVSGCLDGKIAFLQPYFDS